MAPKAALPKLSPQRVEMTAERRKQNFAPGDVYAVVRKIPRGKVATYGQIAALMLMPRHARHVGNALGNVPTGVKIPWHRVVNGAGKISLRLSHWESGSEQLQRILLEDEGVVFGANGRIDLKQFRWEPDRAILMGQRWW
jgi:methylated-DNA-protein-cysteine methyltransferase-like protein